MPDRKDSETKPWAKRGAAEVRLSLRGAAGNEAISVFGQSLLRGVHPELAEAYPEPVEGGSQ
jgi:hypothetical protein